MFFDAAGAIMRAAWQAMTTVQFPGTGISIAAILIGAFLAVLSLKLVSLMIGHVNFNSASRGIQRLSRRNDKGSK